MEKNYEERFLKLLEKIKENKAKKDLEKTEKPAFNFKDLNINEKSIKDLLSKFHIKN